VSIGSLTALHTFLEPLDHIFAENGVNEISINRPGEVWIERRGDMTREIVPQLTLEHLQSLAHLTAQFTQQMISSEKPLLSATLPQGYRIQVIFPPACDGDSVIMSIRKQTVIQLSLDEYERIGAFDTTKTGDGYINQDDEELSRLLKAGEVKKFIAAAVKMRKNIIISGGTSTGKTTFLNAALHEIPTDERIITVEDAREVMLEHLPNRAHLLASRGGQGRAIVTTQDLIEACLRMRPDRIIVGELRGKEAFAYLRAINTGHPGSIATLHADTPKLAIEQLCMMVLQADLGITRNEIREYVESVVQIVIQLKRGAKGRRYVSEIYFKPNQI
jgi:type IV secretion system protein VirB11